MRSACPGLPTSGPTKPKPRISFVSLQNSVRFIASFFDLITLVKNSGPQTPCVELSPAEINVDPVASGSALLEVKGSPRGAPVEMRETRSSRK